MARSELAKATQAVCPGANCLTWTEPGELCEDCWDFRVVVLGRINAFWHRAHDYLEPTRIEQDVVTGGSGPGSRPPLNTHVFAALEASLAVVVGWASRIRERRGLKALPGLSSARSVWLFDYALPELAENDETLVADERPEYYCDLFNAYRLLRSAVGETPTEYEHLDIACPDCVRMTVVMVRHGESLVCLTCHATWSEAAWYAVLRTIRDPS